MAKSEAYTITVVPTDDGPPDPPTTVLPEVVAPTMTDVLFASPQTRARTTTATKAAYYR